MNIREAIDILRQHTGKDLVFDPYKDPDRLAWTSIGRKFLSINC